MAEINNPNVRTKVGTTPKPNSAYNENRLQVGTATGSHRLGKVSSADPVSGSTTRPGQTMICRDRRRGWCANDLTIGPGFRYLNSIADLSSTGFRCDRHDFVNCFLPW